MVIRPSTLLALAALCGVGLSASKEEWRSRTLYQVVTDRFARGDGSTTQCSDLSDYCGGTWNGIAKRLDYIQNMGFDAIWISPIPVNAPKGYHGWNELNSHFGGEADLKNLVGECHKRGMWVMLDVVGNHIGTNIDNIGSYSPFNTSASFHDCSGCPSNCQIQDFGNQPQVEHCRLAGLPDLNQSVPFVRSTIKSWAAGLVKEYDFDGLRVDTVPEVAADFWSEFTDEVGVFTIGEVFNGDPGYVASYQGPLDATLSYPLFFTLRSCFGQQQSLYQLQNQLKSYSAFSDPSVLGTFIDNHDNPRFLNGQQDQTLYRNAILYVLMGQGVPIIYYGTEQGFSGGKDPQCREALWPTDFDETSSLYAFIAEVNKQRQQQQVWKEGQTQRYADDNFYAFTRGDTFVALTNVGSQGQQVTRKITYHPYAEGTTLCSTFNPSTCVTVQSGVFTVNLDGGKPDVLIPQQSGEATGVRGTALA